MKIANSMMKKCILAVLSLVFFITVFSSTVAAKNSDVVDATNAVVRILAIDPYTNAISTGSAFGIGEKGATPQYFVTNRHVVTCEYYFIQNKNGEYVLVDDSESASHTLELQSIQIYIMKSDYAMVYNALTETYKLESSQLVPCEVVYSPDAEYPDIAILKSAEPVEGRTVLPLANDLQEDSLAENVYALGFPALTDNTNVSAFSKNFVADVEDVVITKGILSRYGALKSEGNFIHLEHDATLNHGNSGGPLVDENGIVYGVNAFSYGGNAYYAVSIKPVISQCKALGIRIWTVNPYSHAGLFIAIGSAAFVIAVVVVLIVVLSQKGKNQYGVEDDQEFNQMPRTHVDDKMFRIQGLSGYYANQRKKIVGNVFIGCGAKNNLPLPEGTSGVSHRHCVLSYRNDGSLYITDLGSTYGTFLGNGQRITAHTQVRLQKGDIFWIGSRQQAFQITGAGGASN